MHHIFSFGLVTGKHAMGSDEPLGSLMLDFPGTPDVDILDGPDKPFEPVPDRKRKRGGLMEEEINVFCNMTEMMKEVATAIRECKPLDVHPEALMAALRHLLDNKAQGVGFVAMANAHRVLWLSSWLGKHYY
jgi:hypothetical protein